MTSSRYFSTAFWTFFDFQFLFVKFLHPILLVQLFLCRFSVTGWLGSRVDSVLDSGAEGPRFKLQPQCYRVSLRKTVHTHCASVHQAAKFVATLLRAAGGGKYGPGGK